MRRRTVLKGDALQQQFDLALLGSCLRLIRFHSRKHLKHFCLGWCMQHIIYDKLFGMWIVGLSDTLGSFLEIIIRMVEIDLGVKQ